MESDVTTTDRAAAAADLAALQAGRAAMAAGGAVLGVVIALVGRWWAHIYTGELREEL